MSDSREFETTASPEGETPVEGLLAASSSPLPEEEPLSIQREPPPAGAEDASASAGIEARSPAAEEIPLPAEEGAAASAEEEAAAAPEEEIAAPTEETAAAGAKEEAATQAGAAEVPPEQLEENLRRKEALCVRAEELAESTDWKVAASEIKALQAEWKTIGPMPEEQAPEVWGRFRKAGNHFFERRHAHFEDRLREQEENKQKKEALCVQAEELAGSTDWKATAEGFKTLQAQWKAVGPAPRDQADALWQRFRKANDEFFDRRKVHFDEVEKEQKENVRRKEELCVKAEELCESSDFKATGEAMKAMQAEWKAVGAVPKQKSDALWKRFRGAMDRFFERRSAWYEERDQRKAEWKERLRETLTYKQEQLERLRESIGRDEENITRWRERLEGLRPGPHADEARAELDGKITDVTNRVETKRTRIQELEKDIQEIEAKL